MPPTTVLAPGLTLDVDSSRRRLRDGAIELPERKTFRRWLSLAGSRLSLTRALEEEAIDGLTLRGRVLDLGGHRRSSYYNRLRIEGTVETVNFDILSTPDHVWDLEKPLPFADGSYDHVVSCNTLEHICRDEQLIGEAIRVLRDDGSFHFLVPFCHKVHGSPRDYHRHTAEWWLQTMLNHPCGSVRVRPLVWDRRSTGAALIKSGVVLRALVMALPDPRAMLSAMRGARRTGGTVGELVLRSRAEFALGYYVSGTRRGTDPAESNTCA